MKNIILLSFFVLTILSCNSDNSSMELLGETAVSIRVENSSQFDFQNLVLIDSDIGPLLRGERSRYFDYEMAYRYGFINLDIGAQNLQLIPIDFVGEELLENGFYTYKLDIIERDGSLESISIELIEDE